MYYSVRLLVFLHITQIAIVKLNEKTIVSKDEQ